MKNVEECRKDMENLIKVLEEAEKYVRLMIEKKKSFFGSIKLFFSSSEYKEKIK